MSAVPAPQPTSYRGPTLVAIDDGYAMTKLVSEDGKTLKIPTNARATTEGVRGIMGNQDLSIGSYEAEGERFTVGDEVTGDGTRFPDFPYSAMNRAIVNHALVAAGYGGRQVRLATSLPLRTYWTTSGQVNRDVVQRKVANLGKQVISLDNRPLAQIVSNTVQSEAVAAWIDHVVDASGKMTEVKGTAAIIDIGGRTTDIAVLLKGTNIDFSRCDTKNVGALDLYEALRGSFAQKFSLDGNEIPSSLLVLAAQNGTFKINGKEHDVQRLVEQHRTEIESRIARVVSQQLGRGLDIEHMIFVGGGAMLFSGVTKKFGEGRATIPHAPEFANARGMLKAMRFKG